MFAVRGADVLGGHDGHGVVGHLRGEARRQPLPAITSSQASAGSGPGPKDSVTW